MKKILRIQLLGALLVSTSVIANTQNSCDNLTGCKKKICHIEKDIAVAKKMENKDRVKGLQISLEKVNKHCTDDKLIKDLEDKIEDTQKDLQEDRVDYEKALKDNKPDKVKKYKAKMAEENSKIKRLKQELKELQ